MKRFILLLTVTLICFSFSVAAASPALPECEFSLGYVYLGDSLELVQEKVGNLTFTKKEKNPFFPITFDSYETDGLKLDFDETDNTLFWLQAKSADFSTPSGIKVGDSYEVAKSEYGIYRYTTTRTKDNIRLMIWDNYKTMKRMIIGVSIDTDKIVFISVGNILD